MGHPKSMFFTILRHFCFIRQCLKCLERSHFCTYCPDNHKLYHAHTPRFIKVHASAKSFRDHLQCQFFTILRHFCFLQQGPKVHRKDPFWYILSGQLHIMSCVHSKAYKATSSNTPKKICNIIIFLIFYSYPYQISIPTPLAPGPQLPRQ